MNLQTTIFVGRSGCGKGTQVEKLIEYIKKNDKRKIFHLEAGDRFRSFIKKGNYSAKLANEINEVGGLQPEFLSVWAWGGEVVKGLKEDQHLFIDGTPRRLIEAKVLESLFDFYGRQHVDIVYINVSRESAIKRLQARGRGDDQEMSDILNRLDWFDDDVVPVLDYYRAHKSHTFHDINGEGTVDEVYAEMIQSLGI